MGLEVGDILPFEEYGTLLGPIKAVDTIEQAGFAAVEIVGGFDADSDSTASFGVIAKRA